VLQIRIAVLNGSTAFGIPVMEAAGQVRPAKGQPRSSADLCNGVVARARLSTDCR
jgi:hypothetical protein